MPHNVGIDTLQSRVGWPTATGGARMASRSWLRAASRAGLVMLLSFALGACTPEADDEDRDGGVGGTSPSGGMGTGGNGGAPVGGSAGRGTGGQIVGPCEFRTVPGTATISSIAAATPSDGTVCPGGSISVRYQFAPDDTSLSPASYDVTKYGFDTVKFHQLHVSVGSTSVLLPRGCVEQLGLAVGDEFADNRSVIIIGGCAPVYDTFPTLELAACVSLCK